MTEPIPTNEIVDYATYPKPVKLLISQAAKLAKEKLTYSYGSSDPKNGVVWIALVQFIIY